MDMAHPVSPERTVSSDIVAGFNGARLNKGPRRTAMAIESRQKAPLARRVESEGQLI